MSHTQVAKAHIRLLAWPCAGMYYTAWGRLRS